jgi:hypothetical protein
MNYEQAEQFLIDYCKGIGPLYREKWVRLVQLAYERGKNESTYTTPEPNHTQATSNDIPTSTGKFRRYARACKSFMQALPWNWLGRKTTDDQQSTRSRED